jgi:Uma2 family endonuclease
MPLLHAKTKRWTTEEYLNLSRLGAFQPGEKVELIEGEIVTMASQESKHLGAIVRSTKVLVLALHDTHDIGCQVTSLLTDYSAPEPDFIVFPNGLLQPGQHIRHGQLIMEVADSSLAYDRHEKASLYAKARIPEYWILNVRGRCLEVHRDPVDDPTALFGASYRTRTVLAESGTVSPLCRPDVVLRVADLL